jgi:hypothetical protein
MPKRTPHQQTKLIVLNLFFVLVNKEGVTNYTHIYHLQYIL